MRTVDFSIGGMSEVVNADLAEHGQHAIAAAQTGIGSAGVAILSPQFFDVDQIAMRIGTEPRLHLC